MTALAIYYLGVHALGLAAALALGLSRLPASRLNNWAIVLGLATNLAIQLPKGGRGLCLGTILFPVVFICVALVGRGMRVLLLWFGVINEPVEPVPLGPTCSKCGYLLIGLPDDICPECGQQFTVIDESETGPPSNGAQP
jgi:hypothetical protein